tara:strand:- start:243 stop:437 length:195 start_codon:yes stop_codon:yes gene_type:complete
LSGSGIRFDGRSQRGSRLDRVFLPGTEDDIALEGVGHLEVSMDAPPNNLLILLYLILYFRYFFL